MARRVCENLEDDERVGGMVEECVVDDFDRWCRGYSMGAVLAVEESRYSGLYRPKDEEDFDLRSLTYGIKRAVKGEPAELNFIEHPEGVWDRDHIGPGSSFRGYKMPYTMFDLDVLV